MYALSGSTTRNILLLCIGFGLAWNTAILPAQAATFTVNTTLDAVDTNAGDGVCLTATNTCTIRAAIQEANALAGNDTVTIPAGTSTLSLAGADDIAAVGDLDITSTMIITGASATSTSINANSIDRVFHVTSSGNLTLNTLTITGGLASADGGGIHNAGILTITGVIIKNNITAAGGGGINLGMNSDTTVMNSTINNNTASDQSGGGIAIASTGATLLVTNSTLVNNTATTYGGGISIIESNGGADSRPYVIRNSTFTNNSPASIYSDFELFIANTIVADSCGIGTFTSEGYNIDSGNTCGFSAGTDKINTNPKLHTSGLQNNGGAITTIALQTTSPAINSVPLANCTTNSGGALTTDQRGLTRPDNSACDAGAYELDTTAPAITVTNNNPATNTVECAATTIFTDPGATAVDNADAILGSSLNVTASGTVTTTVPANYTLTYSATDTLGNTAATTRVVTVQDSIAPSITISNSSSIQINEGETYSDAGAIGLDACDSSVAITTLNQVNTDIPGTYLVTYTATDNSENTATATRTVTVVEAVPDPIVMTQKNDTGTITLTDQDSQTQTITPFSGKNNFRYALSTDAIRCITTNGKIVRVYINGELITEKRILRKKSNRLVLRLASLYASYDSIIIATSGQHTARLITLRLTANNGLKKVAKTALPTVTAHPKLRLSLKTKRRHIILKFEQRNYPFKLKKNGTLVNVSN